MGFEKIKMNGIVWQNLELKRSGGNRERPPMVSVNPHSGRIGLNKTACELIKGLLSNSQCYAEPLQGVCTENDKTIFGLRFSAERPSDGSFLPVKMLADKKQHKTNGCVIVSKELASLLGGEPEYDENGRSRSKRIIVSKADDDVIIMLSSASAA